MTPRVYIGPLGSYSEVEGVGPSSGFDPFAFPSRADFSVNSARVEYAQSATPVLHTQTAGPIAGGFNGGGQGTKSILGFDIADGLALSALVSFEYTWLNLVPFVVGGLAVYANFIVDLFGNGTVYKILVIDPLSVVALNNGTTITNGDGSKTTSLLFASQWVLVVLDVPGYPPGVPVPQVNLAPGGSWLSRSYSVADIAAAYPLAVLRRASSLDGGLPKATVTPAVMLITGDSSNNRISNMKLSNVKLNGVAV